MRKTHKMRAISARVEKALQERHHYPIRWVIDSSPRYEGKTGWEVAKFIGEVLYLTQKFDGWAFNGLEIKHRYTREEMSNFLHDLAVCVDIANDSYDSHELTYRLSPEVILKCYKTGKIGAFVAGEYCKKDKWGDVSMSSDLWREGKLRSPAWRERRKAAKLG